MTSKIDWLDGGDTVNFFTGCNGPGGTPCDFCYARRMATRLSGIKGTVYERVKYATGTADSGTGILDSYGDPFSPAFHRDVYEREQERLTRYRRGGKRPGYTARPRRIFVGSMGDMCFEGLARCFDSDEKKMVCPSHMYTDGVQRETAKWSERVGAAGHTILLLTKRPDLLDLNVRWPANVHLGVSVTSDADAGRIKQLLTWREFNTVVGPSCLGGRRGPFVLWASVEPLLGNLDPECLRGLGWVVCGLQSGPGAPKMEPRMGAGTKRWVLDKAVKRIIEWCRSNAVPVFVKSSVPKALGGEWPTEYPEVGK